MLVQQFIIIGVVYNYFTIQDGVCDSDDHLPIQCLDAHMHSASYCSWEIAPGRTRCFKVPVAVTTLDIGIGKSMQPDESGHKVFLSQVAGLPVPTGALCTPVYLVAVLQLGDWSGATAEGKLPSILVVIGDRVSYNIGAITRGGLTHSPPHTLLTASHTNHLTHSSLPHHLTHSSLHHTLFTASHTNHLTHSSLPHTLTTSHTHSSLPDPLPLLTTSTCFTHPCCYVPQP